MNSILSDELTAIKDSLIWVEHHVHPPRQIAIISDSLGALLAIRAGHTEHHTISDISRQLWKLTQRKLEVDFIWIPGHKGIGSNPEADRLAKEAASLPNDDQKVILTNSEMKTVIHCICMKLWNEEYQASDTGDHYKRLFRTVTDTQNYTHLSRRYSTILFRLQSGHCRLNSHLHRIGQHENGLCEACMVDESVQHFILLCPKYSGHRERLKDTATEHGLRMELPEILSNLHTIVLAIEFTVATGRDI